MNVDKLELISIDKLIPYANNARTHSDDQIKKIQASIREFGFVNPVLIDKDYGIIAGHGRVEAAKREGMTEVPCVWVEHLTEAQKKAYILADNKLAEMAGWDIAMLEIELEELASLDFDIGATGFDCDASFFGAGNTMETSDEYEAFLDKFKPKLTTDDCYTPENIYETIKNWAIEHYEIGSAKIVRPFYPGGDYEQFKYPSGCVVVDNPPFSILSNICRFYEERKIKYFLFAPSLTLFSTNSGKSNYIPTPATVTYENGAAVNTSFVTNMGDYKIEISPDLYEAIAEENDKNLKEMHNSPPKYEYPVNVINVSSQKLAKYGQALKIKANDAYFVRCLDAQKEKDKAIYGGGFLISEKAAAEKAAAEKWALSEREIKIIKSLGG